MRPKHEKEAAYKDMHLGILVELHKQFTMLHRYASRDTLERAQQLIQRIEHIDHIVEEIDRLVPQLPPHKDMGLSEGDKGRFVTAAKHARNFTTQQLINMIGRSQSVINYKLAMRRKEDANQIADWIDEILDASMGYKKAHNWTRPDSKAPPLPTSMWRQGKYISHPHEIGGQLLKDWGRVWTQDIGDDMAEAMWMKLRQLIITSRQQEDPMDEITEEDVIRRIKHDVQ